MLGFWNRAELLITYDLKRFCQVRDALQAAGIDYQYKTMNRTSPTLFAAGSRERAGDYAIRDDARLEYRLFVHRDNLEWAQTLLKELR